MRWTFLFLLKLISIKKIHNDTSNIFLYLYVTKNQNLKNFCDKPFKIKQKKQNSRLHKVVVDNCLSVKRTRNNTV